MLTDDMKAMLKAAYAIAPNGEEFTLEELNLPDVSARARKDCAFALERDFRYASRRLFHTEEPLRKPAVEGDIYTLSKLGRPIAKQLTIDTIQDDNMSKRYARPIVGQKSLTATESLRRLKPLLEKGQQILMTEATDAIESWSIQTSDLMDKAFGANSETVNRIYQVGGMSSVPINPTHDELQRFRLDNLKGLLGRLAAAENILALEADDEARAPQLVVAREMPGPSAVDATGPAAAAKTMKVFVVHGRDDGAKNEISNYLRKLKLLPIVLHEFASNGADVLGKLIANGDVGYAVVLLTPDDIGGLKGTAPDALTPRARQNVLLELGYFIGRLGRDRVCALRRHGVDLPSDYVGPVYIAYDEHGAWHLQLAKELKAAGFKIDMNDL